MESENVIVQSISGQVSFGVRRNDLTYNQTKVLKLINTCVSKKVLLDEYILQDWFMEEIVKPRNRIVNGKYLGYRNENGHAVYERILEYDLYKRRIKERGGLLDCWDLGEAKRTLKNCIGALVVRGYLTVIPNIQLSDTKEIEDK